MEEVLGILFAVLFVFLGVAFPIAIVWLIVRAVQNKTNRKTEVLLRAIESGQSISPNDFQAIMNKQKPLKQKLLNRLTAACIMSFIGVAFIVMGIIEAREIIQSQDVPDYEEVWVGSILLAIGMALFIVYIEGKKMMAKEIETEERDLEKKK